MKIALGSDHAGYDLKEEVAVHLKNSGCEIKDHGVFSRDSADYPDTAETVSQAVQSGEVDFGILVCGTGIGMSIAANKRKGIRAALCAEPYSARCAREHNNANILTLGSRVPGPGLAINITDVFMATSFEGGRHLRRVDKITELENNR